LSGDLTPREPQRTLDWPDVVFELHDALMDAPNPVYLVGGPVRDAFLKRPVQDIDLTVGKDAIKLARHIANHFNGDFYPLDKDRDVGRALIETPNGKVTIDVARFREEGLLEDLAGRDFTLNAMAVQIGAGGDLSLLIDPLNGEADALKRLIRRCGPASISDDPIRALRAVRQSIQLSGHIETQTLRDIRMYGPQLAETSPERVRDEFIKLLAVSKPASALRLIEMIGLLAVVLPEALLPDNHQSDLEAKFATIDRLTDILASISPTRNVDKVASFTLGVVASRLFPFLQPLRQHLATVWPNERPHRALMVLAALLWRWDVGLHAAEAGAQRLRLSNDERERLIAMGLFPHPVVNGPKSAIDEGARQFIYHYWRDHGVAGVDVCLLTLAWGWETRGVSGSSVQAEWMKLVEQVVTLLDAYFNHYETMVAPPSLLDGNALMQALGIVPGPQVGELLELIREGQAVGDITSIEEALRAARAYLDGGGRR